MDGFSLITDHNLLLRSGGMFDGGTDASSMFAADVYASVANYSSGRNTFGAEDEHNKGKDPFFCDLPELGDFDDLETDIRNYDPTFEIGSGYFDDTLWSSICSPEAQLVPSSCCFGSTNKSTTATFTKASSVSVPDQINTTHSTSIQQKTASNDGRNHTLPSYEAHASSSEEIDQISLLTDAELFGPFDDDNVASAKQFGLEAMICSDRKMQVPTASSSPMLPDESVVTSSTSSVPGLVSADIPCSKRKKLRDTLHGAPDMLLDGMAENPLEMLYFPPPPATFQQPEMLMSCGTSEQEYQFHIEEFAGRSSVPHCAGMQFCSKGMSIAELREQPRSTMILEAVPVKDFGFQKLQKGMNQIDVATKGRIRDALYRLANSVEQKHYVGTSGLVAVSSSSKGSGGWTETQTNPMDQSVAQLLLKKPPHKNTVPLSRVA